MRQSYFILKSTVPLAQSSFFCRSDKKKKKLKKHEGLYHLTALNEINFCLTRKSEKQKDNEMRYFLAN